jgi:hypothetical protein
MADSRGLGAVRRLDDAIFIRTIFESDRYPEVRAAILADLRARRDVQRLVSPARVIAGHATR